MSESIEELRKLCDYIQKDRYHYPIALALHKKLSIYLTKVFLKMNMSANQVTLLSFIVVFIAGLLLAFGNYWYSIIAALLYQLFILLDCCDGEIARYRFRKQGTENIRGIYLESISPCITNPFILLCLGFNVYVRWQNVTALILGLSSSISLLLLHNIFRIQQHLQDHHPIYFSIPRTIGGKSAQMQNSSNDRTNLLFRIFDRSYDLVNRYFIFEFSLLVGAIFDLLWPLLHVGGIVIPSTVLGYFIVSFYTLPKEIRREEKIA